MEALILLETGDEIILYAKDMKKKQVIFHEYDFENRAMIVKIFDELQVLEYNEIEYVEFSKPIKFASMINNRLALSQHAVDRWRDSHRIKIADGDNFLVGDGVLTASTRAPILIK